MPVSDPDEDISSLPFTANFNSDCGEGDEIQEGDEIVMWRGEPWHVGCAEEEGAEVPT